MAIDITVYPNLDPRIVVVEAPQSEASVQDVVNAIRAWEDSIEGHLYEPLIDAAGKEDLGGSVSVGITATLQNAKLRFAARPEALSIGSATSADSNGQILTDTAADFIADGVYPGCTVINTTTYAQETIITVTTNTLTTFFLQSGSRQDWQIGDNYRVYPNELCTISGGNLVAVDQARTPIDPVFQAPNINVVRSSASSATTTDLEAIQYASYQNAVWIDVTSSTVGTEYDAGTRENPVNNLNDAVAIANERGFKRLQILESMTLDSGTDIEGFEIVGQSQVNTAIIMDPNAQCYEVTIRDCQISGTLDGGTYIKNCIVGDLYYVNGHIHNSGIEGTIYLEGSEDALIANCYQSSGATCVVDLGGTGQNLTVVNFTGRIQLENGVSPTNVAAIAFESGQLIIDSTITSGMVIVSGIGAVTNNGTPTMLSTDGLMSKETIATAVWDEPIDAHTILGTSGDMMRNMGFLDGIWVDTSSPNAGTDYPNGTQWQPVNNIADALTISANVGIKTLRLFGMITLTQDLESYIVEGQMNITTDIVVCTGFSIAGSYFKNLTVTGSATGAPHYRDCLITDFSGLEGVCLNTALGGTLTLGPPGTYFQGNVSGLVDLPTTIDMGGAGRILKIDYIGELVVQNCINGAPFPSYVQIAGAYGSLTLDSTCTGGTALVQGDILVTNGGGGIVVTDVSLGGRHGYGNWEGPGANKFNYVAANNGTTLSFGVWLENGGEPRLDLDSVSLILKNNQGGTVYDFGTNTTPSSNGVYWFQAGSGILSEHTAYYLVPNAVAGTNTWTTNMGLSTGAG
jgi:hypothetical protein